MQAGRWAPNSLGSGQSGEPGLRSSQRRPPSGGRLCHFPALGNGAADNAAGAIQSMFDFSHATPPNHRLFLDPSTGEPESESAALHQLSAMHRLTLHQLTALYQH